MPACEHQPGAHHIQSCFHHAELEGHACVIPFIVVVHLPVVLQEGLILRTRQQDPDGTRSSHKFNEERGWMGNSMRHENSRFSGRTPDHHNVRLP